ncbi:MAG: hypothetical protein ABUL65_01165, partial [Opitutus sp.]
MTSPDQTAQLRLAPPGAGLPPPELFVARLIFAVGRRVTSRAGAEARIVAERARIDALVRDCAPSQARQRVLIPRPRGLEDSSRHWSVFMTLDHLRIFNEGIAATIRELLAGRVPPGAASTAAVKPSAAVGPAVLPAFERSCAAIVQAGRTAPSLRTAARYSHP